VEAEVVKKKSGFDRGTMRQRIEIGECEKKGKLKTASISKG
jgi:hypothetical protein